jgi:hypothetical protein
LKTFLFLFISFNAQKVDCSGRCSTPAGIAGKLRPHRAKHEEAQLTPRGKRAPGAEINHYSLFQKQQSLKNRLSLRIEWGIELADDHLPQKTIAPAVFLCYDYLTYK